MNKIVFYIALILVFFNSELSAQQEAMYTQFFSNKLILNPGYAGSRDAFSIVGLSRHQWVGFEGAPNTQTLSLHSPIRGLNSAVGVTLLRDRIGIQEDLIATLNYAYILQTGSGKLGMGISAQIERQSVFWKDSNPLESSDPNFAYDQESIYLPNFGFGLYFYDDNYYIGASIPNIIEGDRDYISALGSFERRHFYGMAAYVFTLSEMFKLKPAVLAKYQPTSPLEFDFNGMLIIADEVWLGGTYRTGDSFDFIAQYHFKDSHLRVGYAHDFTFTNLQSTHNGTHEVMVGYDFDKQNKGIYHPRYF